MIVIYCSNLLYSRDLYGIGLLTTFVDAEFAINVFPYSCVVRFGCGDCALNEFGVRTRFKYRSQQFSRVNATKKCPRHQRPRNVPMYLAATSSVAVEGVRQTSCANPVS